MKVLLLVAVTLVACQPEGDRGGFGSQPPPPTTSPSPGTSIPEPPEARTVEVSAVPGLAYEPDSLRVEAGEAVEFVLRNEDDQDHTLVVDDLPLVILAAAGQTVPVEVAIHPDRRGRFPFYCQIDGHRAQGMEGTLRVARSG